MPFVQTSIVKSSTPYLCVPDTHRQDCLNTGGQGESRPLCRSHMLKMPQICMLAMLRFCNFSDSPSLALHGIRDNNFAVRDSLNGSFQAGRPGLHYHPSVSASQQLAVPAAISATKCSADTSHKAPCARCMTVQELLCTNHCIANALPMDKTLARH